MRYKFLFSLALNLLFLKAIGQTNEVSLVVSSKGTTEEEAKTNALRSAIEQAFGTFVSSRTEILNDDLVQDQMVSLSNGNIKKFEILSSLYLPEQNSHLVTLNATVSLDKLTSFVQSKGYNDVSFDGGGFAMNLKIQKLNASSEVIAIENLLEQGLMLSEGFFDRELKVGDPKLETSNDPSSLKYVVPLTVNTILSSNWSNFHDYYIKTLKNISMSKEEVASYKDLNKMVYEYVVVSKTIKEVESYDPGSGTRSMVEQTVYRSLDTLAFRTKNALSYLTSFCVLLNAKYLDGVQILHNLDTVNLDIDYNSKYRIASRREFASDLWLINSMPYDLPFVQSSSIITHLVKSSNNYYEMVKAINYFPETLSDFIMPIFNFTENGYRIQFYQAEDEFRKPLTNSLNLTDYSSALKSIQEQIINRRMPGGNYDFETRIYEIENPLSIQYQIRINASFTELELEQIKGFKLLE